MNEWQPIDKAPKDGTTILGWWINGEQHTGSICDGEWIPAWEHQNENWGMPQYWMPLPDDPSREMIEAAITLRGGER